ncbi:MAG: phosphomethylpyrimidine synthase ThiC, partial [Chloroflexota bacterium]|nr:phosphomethylpyrimidine synthase ThiC [Chloroflexota bacterium]
DVREGVIAARIAGHAADIVKGVKGAWEWDKQMSEARKRLDWEGQALLSLDPTRVKKGHAQIKSTSTACSMCGEFCAMELVSRFLDSPTAEKC